MIFLFSIFIKPLKGGGKYVHHPAEYQNLLIFPTLCCYVLHMIAITCCKSGYTRQINSILRHSQLLSISSTSSSADLHSSNKNNKCNQVSFTRMLN